MSNYIKREDAIDACLEETSTKWSTKEEAEEGRIIASVIKSLPSADVVEVVRCKDCKKYMTIHCTCDGCCISDEWYCADGERKDGE